MPANPPEDLTEKFRKHLVMVCPSHSGTYRISRSFVDATRYTHENGDVYDGQWVADKAH